VLIPVVVVLVGAWMYRWVDEDAFIDFRIIHNLLAGHGPVFNIGERVEADSDPLWLLTLAALHVVLPFASLEWTSVVLGLVCTGAGFLTGGLAAVRLGQSRGEGTVLPLGLLVASVVAGVWEFATSGLEMSMVFLWLGCSFLLLVRVESGRSRPVPAAVVFGLGCLIRPELLLGAAILVAALLLLTRPSKGGPRWKHGAVLVLAALAVPVAYQLFRTAYYALVVPSTALAKAAGASWWSQGATYLWNLLAPYTLWVPLALAVPIVWLRTSAWWRAGDRRGVLLVATPLAVGASDALYVVHLGGDYMHARLLLPGLFALLLPVWVDFGQLRGVLVMPAVGIVVWAVVCAGWLRFVPPKIAGLTPQTVFISNERNSWISATGEAHPVTAGDYRRALSGAAATDLTRLSRDEPADRKALVVVTNPFLPIATAATRPARSTLPFSLAVNLPAVGVIGYLSGPDVYVFDEYSLANPVGSHVAVVRHARPGHEKFIGPAWMVARFGVAGTAPVAGGPSSLDVAAARVALGCNPLAAYLHAVTAPWTVSQAVANVAHAWGFTTFSYSADPVRAAGQLCGRTALRSPRGSG
jgi:arabinofuranosyltransferase